MLPAVDVAFMSEQLRHGRRGIVARPHTHDIHCIGNACRLLTWSHSTDQALHCVRENIPAHCCPNQNARFDASEALDGHSMPLNQRQEDCRCCARLKVAVDFLLLSQRYSDSNSGAQNSAVRDHRRCGGCEAVRHHAETLDAG
jgi:hypothetical protein